MKLNLKKNLKKEAGKALDFMDQHGMAVSSTVAVLVLVGVGAECIKVLKERDELLSSLETSNPLGFIEIEHIN